MRDHNSKSDSAVFGQIARYMEIAAAAAKKSTCAKTQRGVVIVKNDRIVSAGWNGPHEDCPVLADGTAMPRQCSVQACVRYPDEIQRKNLEKGLEGCYGLHAEMRAILNCHDLGGLRDADLYHIALDEETGTIRTSPARACSLCAPHILEVGIRAVFLLHHSDKKSHEPIGDWGNAQIVLTEYPAFEYFDRAFEGFEC